MEKGQKDVTSVTMHFVMQAIYRNMWKISAVKGETIVTSVTMHLFMEAIYRNIWKCTAEKGHTNATSVTMHLFMHAIWKKHLKTQSRKSNKCNQCNYESSQECNLKTPIKYTVGKSQTNATNVAMPPLNQVIWGNVWKWRKNNQVQPVWLCIFLGKRPDESHENAH